MTKVKRSLTVDRSGDGSYSIYVHRNREFLSISCRAYYFISDSSIQRINFLIQVSFENLQPYNVWIGTFLSSMRFNIPDQNEENNDE